MKQVLLIIICALLALGAQAQTADEPQRRATDGRVATADTLRADSMEVAPAEVSLPWFEPALTVGGYALSGAGLYGGAYDAAWRLHEGLNAQFGLSLSAAFGKHAPKGVGFGQTAAFAYLLPVTNRLSVVAGIFAENMDWGAWRQTNLGLAGMMAYQLTDRINLYAYGSKTFLPQKNDFRMRREPFPLFLDQPRDRFGAAAEFKIGNNAMIGVSVETTSY